MSDNWITLIPENPGYVPDAARRERARDLVWKIAPDAEDIEVRLSDHVDFFDCGQNFERVFCPTCRAEIAVDWWRYRMDDDSDGSFTDLGSNCSFKLARYRMPCCNAVHTLHELVYDWPQGFGRFALDAMNPNIGKLDDKDKQQLEGILGTPLRVIYQHI